MTILNLDGVERTLGRHLCREHDDGSAVLVGAMALVCRARCRVQVVPGYPQVGVDLANKILGEGVRIIILLYFIFLNILIFV